MERSAYTPLQTELLASPRPFMDRGACTPLHGESPEGSIASSKALSAVDSIVQGVPVVTQGDRNPKCFKKQHSFASTGDVFTRSKLRRISSAANMDIHLESHEMHVVRLSTKEKLEG